MKPPSSRRYGIRRRLLLSFVLLTVGMGAVMIIAGLIAYERLGRHLLEVNARPIMRLLMEAEERAFYAEDHGRRVLYWGSDLAEGMDLDFLVGKQVPPDWQALTDGLHLLDNGAEFVLLATRGGLRYSLSGSTGAFRSLRAETLRIFLLCVGVALVAASLLGIVLSRRLSGSLTELTHAVEQGEQPGSLPSLPQEALNDEVGVLARAIAARERDLVRYMQRESFFTGDVSHELRTPLTVLQGGLEVLELRLAGLEGGEALMPVLQRLQRTVLDMSDMVRSLLMLARRPEDIVPESLDVAALVRELCGGDAAVGLECPASVMTVGDEGLARIIFKNLLDNARKYAEDGKVLVSVEDGLFRIRNKGHIPEHLDVFARGVRAPHPAGAPTPVGSGLGLSLALRACEQMGWIIRQENVADREAVFTVSFPREQPEHAI